MAQKKKNTGARNSSSKTSSSKHTSTKSRSQATEQKAAKAAKEAEAALRRKHQFSAVLLFAAGVFLLVLSLFDGPAAWGFLRNTLRGLLGPISYAAGPILIYSAVMTSLERTLSGTGLKLFSILFVLFLLSGAAQLFYGIPEVKGFGDAILSFYQGGIALKSGGIFAMLIGWPLMLLFGRGGAAVILIILVFVSLMLLSGTTLLSFLKGCIRPVKEIEKTYVKRREKREEEERAREVNIDIALDEGEEEMPSHPVKSPKARFEKALEKFKDDPERSKKEKSVSIDPASSPSPYIEETKEETPSSASDEVDRDAISAIIDEFNREQEADVEELTQKTPQTETATLEADPLEDRINQAIDELYAASDHSEEKPPLEATEPEEKTEEYPQNVYHFPPLSLLNAPKAGKSQDVSEELKANAAKLVETLKSFGVSTKIIDISRGPTVTRYELQPSAGVKISKITGLSDDIALNLATAGVRIEAPIPNKAAVGIEVPNRQTETVPIREVIDSKEFESAKSRLTMALGKDIAGNITVGDIASMPHLLIAGATGSGKSVCINSIIISLLYKASPDEVRFLMVDPKVVELGVYNGIPHLLVPVVTDPKKAAGALAWAVNEMLNRYKAFEEKHVRNLDGYNKLASQDESVDPMPQIVIIIDELADLMMAAPSDVEDSIMRLAQMARAAGMHLIIATQRPSVNVITGVIKANIPSRIAFSVSSQVDSRTILDQGGAEKLLGRGDMLYYPQGYAKPVRIQGCYVSDSEVEEVVEFIKNGEQEAEYDQSIVEEIERQAAMEKQKGKGDSAASSDDVDPLFNDAVECVIEAGQASTSYLQRRLKVGYARAARLVDELEERGIVGPLDGSKPRDVLITRQQWIEISMRNSADSLQ